MVLFNQWILEISQRSIMIHRIWSRWRTWCFRDLNKIGKIRGHQISPLTRTRLTIRKNIWLPQLSTPFQCKHKIWTPKVFKIWLPINRWTNMGTLNTNRDKALTKVHFKAVSTKSLNYNIHHSVNPRVKKADSIRRQLGNQPLKRRLQIYTRIIIQIWMIRGAAIKLHLNSR